MSLKQDAQEQRVRHRVKQFLDTVQEAPPKKALKACSEIASDFPHSQLAKSALAVAYYRLGNIKQSLAICEESLNKLSEWINDRSSIYYYSSAMAALDRLDLLEAVWDKAVALDKKSVTFYENLFSACLRTGNTTKQISAAMELWKLTNNDKYLMWSIVARAQPELKPDLPRFCNIATSCDASNSSMILQLSQTMFETKFLQANKVTKHLDLDFILRVMVQQGKLEQALQLIRSDLAIKLYSIPHQRLSEQAGLLLKMEQYDKAIEAYETLLTVHNNDEWSWYLAYFEALFEGLKSPKIPQEKIQIALEMISKLQKQSLEGVKTRGPFLADLELEKILCSKNEHKMNLQVFVNYFDHFASKPTCYRDLACYFNYLQNEDRLALVDNLKQKLVETDQIASMEPHKAVSAVYSIVTFEGIFRTILGPTLNSEARKSKIENLWKIYNQAKQISMPREVTERFCGDNLLILAAHYHCDEFLSLIKSETGGMPNYTFGQNKIQDSALMHLISAACTLEYGLIASKWNFQFRLMLNEVYSALGSIRSCIDQFSGVDIKHIQLDSFGYNFLDVMLRYSTTNDVQKIYKKSSVFYDDMGPAPVEWAFTAYEQGAYHKVKEVATFSQKLRNSAHKVALKLEHLLLQLADSTSVANTISQLSSFDVQNKIPSSLEDIRKLHKNHDLDALDWWALEVPKHKHIEIPPGNIRSSVFPDELQDYRIFGNILMINILKLLASNQPGSASPHSTENLNAEISKFVSDIELILSQFDSQKHYEYLMWNLIKNTITLLIAMTSLSSNLSSDKPDQVNVDLVGSSISAISAGYQEVIKILENSTTIVSSNNVPFITQFVWRPLMVIQFVAPLLPKFLPGKPKPKTPDAVKQQTTTLKTNLRDFSEASKTTLTKIEQLLVQETEQTNNFELDKVAISNLLHESLQSNSKVVNLVLDALAFSRRDASQTLLTIIRNKIRDLK